MATAIGFFNETKNGFEGSVFTLNARAKAEIVPNKKEKEGQPDYRIFSASGLELGGIWKRIANSSGKEHLSATLKIPGHGAEKIYASLVPTKKQKGRHVLLWDAN